MNKSDYIEISCLDDKKHHEKLKDKTQPERRY